MTQLSTLVLDTSALINLYASSQGEAVIAAISVEIAISETVAEELNRETSRMSGQQGFVASLAERSAVSLLTLTEMEAAHFLELTSSSPSLGDGEAATIAIAYARGLMPVIDERRGRNWASKLLAPKDPWWSLDLFRHPSVLADLGPDLAAEALYMALFRGRMRIAGQRADEVIDLIGIERARRCTCLPDYRSRFAPHEQARNDAGGS